ncbi:hypothetical protein PF005_g553 [Phytophthora fragariae]|uniref:Uncharacterized protein n=1 Tax=Phytophthora fragariae TaxID=53985 RepID=A0A6A3MNX0_9STRA|nr:hypothetical protein PF003_g19186 [Phytophthora fragariae]KAE8949851.1 hypothetical protein PF009_g607 [Phytophthora fragariae]KAE9030990.1 hypothetical protein PF011_g339 [Phytophthora fragariae]KAE9139137.1 hypothetical protein PF010_g706 [Phytophthora fragariae]KAE9140453.1 hypothetical protein PF007_g639 [Phytophthora fragariae]
MLATVLRLVAARVFEAVCQLNSLIQGYRNVLREERVGLRFETLIKPASEERRHLRQLRQEKKELRHVLLLAAPRVQFKQLGQHLVLKVLLSAAGGQWALYSAQVSGSCVPSTRTSVCDNSHRNVWICKISYLRTQMCWRS